jgi:hypothetical protein
MSLLKNKLTILAFCGFLGLFNPSFAQREIDPESNPSLKDRMYFGGNLGLQFGTVTMIDVSPLVGVMITPRLSGGVGGTFQYYDDNRLQGAEGTSFGGRLFGRYKVLPNIFVHTEYESINWEAYDFNAENFRRTWTEALFLGAGYFTPFGPRGGANFTFLYNVFYDRRNSYYAEPYVIRVGFVL